MYRSSHRWCSLDLQYYQKETPTQAFSCEYCKIFKNTYFEKHLQTAASNSGYILYKKLSKIIQEPDWPSVSFSDINSLYFTYFHSLSLAVICCHSLSFFATRCHLLYSLSFIVTRCHSLSFVVPLVCLFTNGRLQLCLFFFIK